MLQLHISPGDELPIYRQIMRQISEAIAGRRLRPGDKLSSHRELAERLVIAPLTVKKAYDELEREGHIQSQRGRGTFVAEKPPEMDGERQRERLRGDARRLVTQAYLGGVPLREVVGLVKEEHAKLVSQRHQQNQEQIRT